MPSDEPLHPSFTETDAARESFFEAASQEIETARTARLNPLADKLSAVKPAAKAESTTPQPASPTPPSSGISIQSEAAGKSGTAKIPGPPAVADAPVAAPSDAGNRASASSLPQLDDYPTDIPGPDDFKPGKGGAENWKKLHGYVREWMQKSRALEKQLNSVKVEPKPGTPDPEVIKRLDTLQAERDNLLARLEAVAVEKSPRFEAAFKPRLEAAINQAKAAVGPERAKFIEEVLNLPESTYREEQLNNILVEIGPGIRGAKLAQAVADLDRVTAERHQLASRGNELYKQWQSEEQANYARQQQERESMATKVFADELSNWQQAGHLKDEQEVALARSVFSGQADYTDAARASIWAVVGPKLAAQSMAAAKRVTELEAELAKFRSVQPTPTGGSDHSIQPSEDLPEDIGYGDAIGRLVQQSGLLR